MLRFTESAVGAESPSRGEAFLASPGIDMAQDFVHNAGKRLCCIDEDAISGYVFLCSMQARKEFLFLRFPAPVRWVPRHALIKPPIQCLKVVDFKNKNTVQ